MNTRMMRAIAVVALLAGLARAAEDTIREIQIKALDTFAADTGDVLAVIRTMVGDSLNVAASDKDVRALYDTQRYSLVNVKKEQVNPDRPEDGMRLVYVIVRRHRFVGPVELVGVDYFSRSKVEDWLGLSDGTPIDDQVLAVKCD